MSDAKPFVLTKIIATLGPASSDPAIIVKLIEEGARVFRINFSHGTFEGFGKLLAAVREAGKRSGVFVGALGDLCGPKIRIGQVVDRGVEVKVGDTLIIQKKPIVAGQRSSDAADGAFVFSITAPEIIPDIEPGERLLIDDGAVRALVTEHAGEGDDEHLRCQVTTGGLVTKSKGVNLPDSQLTVPSLTPYDEQCVRWAVENGIDMLALSFVRRAQDVLQLKELLASLPAPAGTNAPMPVIAKIEKPQALEELADIVKAADAVMVARGDLGVEMELTEVPNIQKRIIATAHEHGRPVIVATQMLQSMIESPMPTRAEVSDVANAIYDGAGKVMLSGETAVGKWPVLAVQTMARIARNTHRALLADPELYGQVWRQPPQWHTSGRRSAALSFGVRQIVRDFGAKLVVIWSQLGGGARYLSLCRVNVPIIACSTDEQALRRMNFLFGVHPVMMQKPDNIESFGHMVDEFIRQRGWGEVGDPYVLVAGEPIGVAGTTNIVSLRRLGVTGFGER